MSRPNKNFSAQGFLHLVIAALLIVFLINLFFIPIETEDVWWHLATGRWMVEHHQIPKVDPFPVFGFERPWYVTHWLGSLVFYNAYQVGGFLGLKIFRLVIFVGAFLIFYLFARKKIPFLPLAFLIVIMAYGISNRVLLRPFIFNLIFIQFLLMALYDYYRRSDKKILWVVPLLGAVWSNIHLGSFMYGFPLIAIFWLVNIVEALDIKFSQKDGVALKTKLRQVKTLFLVMVGFWLAHIINPHGLAAALHPLKVLFIPKHIDFHWFNSIINEMQSPSIIFSIYGFWFYLLFGISLLCLIYNQKERFMNTVLFGFGLFMFIYALRGSDLFVPICGYIIATSAENCDFKQQWQSISQKFQLGLICHIVGIVLLSLLSIRLYNTQIYQKGRFIRNFTVDISPSNPFAAIELMKKNNIKGYVLNFDGYGGALLWAGYPDLKPMVDGRQLNRDVFKYFFAVLNNPAAYWQEAVDVFELKIVLINTSMEVYDKLIDFLAARVDWQLIFVDSSCTLWVKRGEFTLPPELNDFEQNLRATQISLSEIESALPEKRKRSILSQIQGWLNPLPYDNDLLQEGATLFALNFREAGIHRIREGVQASKGQGAYFLSFMVEEYKKGLTKE